MYGTGQSAGSAPRLSQRRGEGTPPHSARQAKRNSFSLTGAGACSGSLWPPTGLLDEDLPVDVKSWVVVGQYLVSVTADGPGTTRREVRRANHRPGTQRRLSPTGSQLILSGHSRCYLGTLGISASRSRPFPSITEGTTELDAPGIQPRSSRRSYLLILQATKTYSQEAGGPGAGCGEQEWGFGFRQLQVQSLAAMCPTGYSSSTNL